MKIQLSAVLGIVVCGSVHAGYYPPKDVQVMIERVDILDSKCRGGSGDNPKTMQACNQRDALHKKIEKRGYCWGSYNKDDAGYQYQWLPCKLDATRR